MFYRSSLALGLIIGLAACSTTGPEAPDVFIPPPEIKSCYQISELQRVVIPAVTKDFIAITEIENPPYEPIQRRETITREIEPARIIYTNADGLEITNICKPDEVAVVLPNPS